MPIPVHVAMAAYPLAIWGFTVASVLSDPAFTNLPRNLDAVELWSGVHSIGPPCRECGLRALPFDKCRQGVSGDSEDILTRNGFLNALQLVMRLVVGGLLWQAPVCASMGFPNSSNCKRSTANPLGATTYAPARDAAVQNCQRSTAKICTIRHRSARSRYTGCDGQRAGQ